MAKVSVLLCAALAGILLTESASAGRPNCGSHYTGNYASNGVPSYIRGSQYSYHRGYSHNGYYRNYNSSYPSGYSYSQPVYSSPRYSAPRYSTPQYSTPQYATPSYSGTQYFGGSSSYAPARVSSSCPGGNCPLNY